MAVNEQAQARPAPSLRRYIASYHGYRQRGVAPALHRGLPSPYLTVIVTLDEPLHIACHVDPTQAPGSYDAIIGGLHTSPALIRHDGAQSGIQIALRPLGARALLGLPAGELTGLDLDAVDVLGAEVGRIRARLWEVRTWPERFAVLDVALEERMLRRPGADVGAEVGHVWRSILCSGGTVDVARLAREVGWSQRHLAVRVRTELGLTPKALARVTRFDRARRIIQAGHAPLADVAACCGYYDQSHLAREFGELAGVSPGRWRSTEVRNVQDLDPDRAEG